MVASEGSRFTDQPNTARISIGFTLGLARP
jgi:hypothetical protein